MKIISKHILILLLLGFLPLLTRAQVNVKLQAPSQTAVGERIRISYIVNTADVEDINVGEFPGFRVLYGPSTSTSSSFSMTNGKTTQSSSMTFTYTVTASKEGVHTIPAATVTVKGQQYSSNTQEIEILPASDPTTQHQQSQGSGHNDNNSSSQRSVNPKELYITATANKTKVFEQEAILLTYKLYTLVNIQQIAGDMPQLDGFHVQEVDSKAQMSLKYERVNGQNYGTAIWRQYVLYPQKSGRLKIPSLTFDAQIEMHNTSMDPFDIFFGGGSLTQIVQKSLVAPAIEIEVASLPTPKPQNFSGAVGDFSVTASMKPLQLKANDAATLSLVVSGCGNMKLMKAPKVNFPKDFEVYDPKQTEKIVHTGNGDKGSITFDYLVVPRLGGEFQIPPVAFSYFDTQSKEYKTLHTDSFAVSVEKSKGHTPSAVGHTQEDLKVLSNDIRYIKLTPLKVRKSDETFFGSTKYWMAYLIVLAIFLLLVVIFNKQIKEISNHSQMRGKKAGKAASKRLRSAAKLLKAKDSNAFYDEIMHALLGYAADKLALPTADLNKENVKEALVKRGVEESVVQQFVSVLSECEFARYAPGDPNATMDKIYAEATDVINTLDSTIKK